MTDRATMIKSVERALQGSLGLKGRSITQARFPGVAYVLRPTLRLARHFDPQIDILIVDNRLGTLGLVRVIPPGKAIRNETREVADQSTYLRHILLADQGRKDALAWSVELVLVVYKSSLAEVGEGLREIARTTSYPHSIGVNVLPYGEPFAESDLRRAFCWLLNHTQAWYGNVKGRDPNSTRRLCSLTLDNYRMHGLRRLMFEPARHVHIVHGGNGTGKSSIAEALELSISGQIERLADVDPKDYQSIIAHRRGRAPAKVKLSFREESDIEFVAGLESNAKALNKDLKGPSFRLDQVMMDRLTQMGSLARAEIFLQSFFPDDYQTFRELRQARVEAQKAFQALPHATQTALGTTSDDDGREAAVARRFAWQDTPTHTPSVEEISDCLPLPLTTLKDLSPLAPGLLDVIEAWEIKLPTVEEIPEALAIIDDTVARLQKSLQLYRQNLRLALDSLLALKNWQPEAGAQAEQNYTVTLQRWTTLCALTDLGEKDYQIARVLRDATREGWKIEPDEVQDRFSRPSMSQEILDDLRKINEGWAKERDKLFSQLKQATSGAEKMTGRSRGHLPGLSPARARALDAVGEWLLPVGERTERTLGQALSEALGSNTPVVFGNMVVGAVEWDRPIINHLQQIQSALQQLETTEKDGLPTGRTRWGLIQKARASHKDSQEAAEKVSQTFLKRIGDAGEAPSLNHAINELMALFTPARWAYDDLRVVHHAEPEGKQSVELITRSIAADGSDDDYAHADLQLNTAELNIFTVALFFLCGVRVPNPLSMLILDDPLQNMDELTITTLARGLAKVVRAMPDGWQMLFLFHGEDDLVRFGQEVPSSVYLLKWLTPFEGSENLTISADQERSWKSDQLQDVFHLFSER